MITEKIIELRQGDINFTVKFCHDYTIEIKAIADDPFYEGQVTIRCPHHDIK